MIKVTLGEFEMQEKPFPKLMIATEKGAKDKGIIVFFFENRNGVVLETVKGSDKYQGFYSDVFIMDCFTDYNEPITIQNA